jgi:hypothetical protein
MEARELRDTLDTLLDDPGERHEHVSSSDAQRELTVWSCEADRRVTTRGRCQVSPRAR